MHLNILIAILAIAFTGNFAHAQHGNHGGGGVHGSGGSFPGHPPIHPGGGGYHPSNNGGYHPPNNGGYHPPNNGGYHPPNNGGYHPPNNGGYHPSNHTPVNHRGWNQSTSTYGSGRPRDVDMRDRHGNTIYRDSYTRRSDTRTRVIYDRHSGIERSRATYYNRYVHHTNIYVYSPVHYRRYYDPYRRVFRGCVYGGIYVSYSWGWYNDPWYPYYGYYYRPYRHYYYPSEWILDYYWSSILADEYEDEVDAQTIASQQATIASQQQTIQDQQAEIERHKPQLKKQIEDEFATEGEMIDIDKKLADPNHLFPVGEGLSVLPVEPANAKACNLNRGDLLKLAPNGYTPADGKDQTATLVVASSKRGSCVAGTKVSFTIDQLQEFENEFVRRAYEGAEKLKTDPRLSAQLDGIPNDDQPDATPADDQTTDDGSDQK